MPPPPKRRRLMPEEDLQSQSETQGLEGAQAPRAVEEDASSSTSTCSSSFPSSFPSSASPSSSSSCYPLISSTPEEISADDETSDPSQSAQIACSSPSVIASLPLSQSDEGSSNQKKENPSTLQALPDTESLPRSEIDEKVTNLVQFLLFKYQMKEPITKAEILENVLKNYEDHLPVMFSEASECMQLVFGLDVKEVDPTGQSFVLVISLGLTYDGMLSDVQSMPKTGILIFILSIIFTEGYRASENVIWEALNMMGLYDGMEHFIYGEPRKLLTQDWVQENYLEYRQVPGSDPAQYEFLWGPRAHTEIRKMSLLKFLAKVNGSDPRSFPLWYEEALKDEEERAKAIIATTDDTTATASASSSATTSFSYPE
ncbi:melanoma-associated antigen 10 [Saimiri boliviensis]|uniref:melanoma-associated antigen 10 n=1 Tax=Saimiri boliviensis TaxID=27679 RepID=UPI00027FBDAE|nr:melanoma-associated antigen 10 [Saimiri boliviensis boliviensis]XP_010329571.1 melanoma-associated antigen 10 [Saimiri boliviensis boliviensis]